MSSLSRNMERTFSENELNALASAWDGHRQAVCCEGIKLILQDWWFEVIKFLAVLKLIFTDFCNILWGLREIYRWNHNIKMTILGFTSMGLAQRYVLKPFEGNYIISIPLGFVVCGCLVKISQYINLYMINNPNSAFGSKPNRDYAHLPNDQFKMRKSLYYLGFSQLNPGDEVRMEFAKGLKENITDWWNSRKCDSDKLGTKNVMCDTLLCAIHKGSGTKDDPIDLTEDTDKENDDLDDVDSGSESENELECCDECGERNIDPNDLGDSDLNLADIGGGYAHEWCVTDEKMKDYRRAIGGEVSEDDERDEDDETDEELESIEKDVMDVFGVRPPNPSPESQENKKDK